MNQNFTITVLKSLVYQDEVVHNLSYFMDPEKIPDILSGWEDAGYEIISVNEGVPSADLKEDQ